MRQITLYKIKNKARNSIVFSCNPLFAESMSKKGRLVTCNIRKMV